MNFLSVSGTVSEFTGSLGTFTTKKTRYNFKLYKNGWDQHCRVYRESLTKMLYTLFSIPGTGNQKAWKFLHFGSVLWIRIRKNPNILAGSESEKKFGFGFGS
jgi:hypothetical protein